MTTHQTLKTSTTSGPAWLRLLNWLARIDADHRATRKLRAMPDERLRDMGISRSETNGDFYRRGSRKADGTAAPKLTAFRIG